MANGKSNISLYYQNVNGLRTKLSWLRSSSSIHSHDLIIFTETNLSEEISNSELGLTNFSIYRQDRNNATSSKKSGGGVLVAVGPDISSYSLKTGINDVECVFVALVGHHRVTNIICAVYIPPQQPSLVYSRFCDAVEEICTLVPDYNSMTIIGDFNLPGVNWSSNSQKTNDQASYLIELTSFLNLSQLNNVRNSGNAILDLVFSSDPTATVQRAIDILLVEDAHHPALTINILFPTNNVEQINSTSKDVKRCDSDMVKNWIISNLPQLVNSSSAEAEVSFMNFCNDLREVILANSPLKKVGNSKFPRWFTPDLKQLVINKKIAHKKYKQTLNYDDYIKFHYLRVQCKTLAEDKHREFIHGVESSISNNIKTFWSYTNSLRKTSSVPHEMCYDNMKTSTPQDKCEYFARYFSSVYRQPLVEPNTYTYPTNCNLSTVVVSCEEVENKLALLDVNKGAGPDEIPPVVLRHCRRELAPILTHFFNVLLADGQFPVFLKSGYVVPIHKSGPTNNVENYRPIVIQSTLAKIFESLVLSRLSFALKSIISPNQHGFIKGRSTSTNLLLFQNHVINSFSRLHQVDCLALDFSKAFDKVSHPHLLNKLEAMGVGGSLLQWLKSYLSDRTLTVKFALCKSTPFLVLSGVPQGSHLGPFLFNVFLNDIQEVISSKYLLFADDAKIFREIINEEDIKALQLDLNAVSNWCKENSMDLNIKKSCVVTFHRIKHPRIEDYSINATPLPRTDTVKDLGVTFTSDLNPSEHINNICVHANKILGFLVRSTKDMNNINTLKTLYTALVRPGLEYASVVWSPYQKYLVDKIERIQRRLLRIVGCKLGLGYYSSPTDQLQELLHLQSLASRRCHIDTLFLKRVVSGVMDCPELLELMSLRVPGRTRSRHLFDRQAVSTHYAYGSAIPRLLRAGNMVADQVDFFSQSEASFKKSVATLLT